MPGRKYYTHHIRRSATTRFAPTSHISGTGIFEFIGIDRAHFSDLSDFLLDLTIRSDSASLPSAHTVLPPAGYEPGMPTTRGWVKIGQRSEEHTSELQSLMRKSYDVFCL